MTNIQPYQPGDIAFYRGTNGLLDSTVRWWTGGDYCHAAIIRTPDTIVQADQRGIVVSKLADYKPTAVARVGATLPQLSYGLDWLDKHVGDPYSVADVVSDVLARVPVLNWVFIESPRTYDCSALATWFLIFSGHEFSDASVTDMPSRVNPVQLAHALAQYIS